jgi:hypothetical protein
VSTALILGLESFAKTVPPPGCREDVMAAGVSCPAWGREHRIH